MALLNTANAIKLGSQGVDKVFLAGAQVWPPPVTGFAGSAMVMGLVPTVISPSGSRQADVGGAMLNL